jgi:hypothetical protein
VHISSGVFFYCFAFTYCEEMGYLSCSAVLICAADEEHILAHKPLETGNDVC